MSPKFANFNSKNLIIHIKKVFICQNIINTIWNYLTQLFWGVGGKFLIKKEFSQVYL
jgi:hypothetical protein